MSPDGAIVAQGLTKRFGSTVALDGLDLEAPAGSVLGVLGPNGAGKSTAVRILTTLTRPDGGWARVGGHDVVNEAPSVRAGIGVAAQAATVDELLSGWQNLVMAGRLSGLRRVRARARARELLERFSLAEAGNRMVRTYSGGMRRRLDLAVSIVTLPPVLFLDEPTTGLDPGGRAQVWGIVRELTAGGATVLLTTQYLEEADALADRIVVIDHGRSIASGTAAELKARTGTARLDVRLTQPSASAASALGTVVAGPVQVSEQGRRLQAAVPATPGLATRAVQALDRAGIRVDDVEVRQPSLDDVFFSLTGRPPAEAGGDAAAAQSARKQGTS